MAEPTTSGAKIVGGSAAGVFLLAIALLKPWEGYSVRPYRDIVGVLTVCHGHTRRVEQRVYSDEECGRLLASDMGEAWDTVQRCISAPMTEHQAAAMLSFAFNVGPGRKGVKDGLCVLRNGNEPRVRAFANQGRWAEACAQLSNWVFAGGKRSRGLENRRAAERAMCEGKAA